MVAGFLYGVTKGYAHALRMGIAAGSATAFGETLADAARIYAVLQTLEFNKASPFGAQIADGGAFLLLVF